METVVKSAFFGFAPKMIKQSSHHMVKHNCPRICVFNNKLGAANFSRHSFPSRTSEKSSPYVSSVLSGAKDVEVSSAEFEGFSATTSNSDELQKQLKISVEVSGTKTQTIFDKVFDKMVADAQPIPGFRRVKGGKTPNIPKHILLEVLGRSKVLKQVIKKLINTTIAEYVEKNGLKVGKDMRVEQSIEDLESSFEAGEAFSFDAVLQLK